MNLNVRSVRNKTDMLSVFLHTLHYPHVICLTETWLSNEEAKVLNVPHYNVATYYCRTKTRGGGVAILVRDDIQFSIKSLCSISVTEQQFEAVSINVVFNEVNVNINCLYRSPNACQDIFINSMEKLLMLISKIKGPKFVCADFNYNFAETNKKTQDLTNLFSSFGYNKCFSEFSRTQGNSDTLIDNIFSNINEILTPQTLSNAISDHNAQLITYKLSFVKKYQKCVKNRVFSDENIHNFKHLLSNENWDEVYTEPDNSKKFKIFLESFLNLFNTAFPVKSKKTNKVAYKKSNKWITENIINDGIFIRQLHDEVKSSNDPELRVRYNIIKKNHERNIKNTKKDYYQEKINNEPNKSKAMWDVIKENTHGKNSNKQIPTIMNQDRIYLDNTQDIANGFSSNFINSINKLTSSFDIDTSKTQINKHNEHTIYLTPVTEEEISNIIIAVCRKKSSGNDEIPCCLIKDVAKYLLTVLTYLINISFENGHFPDQLKSAIVIPVHKNKDTTDMNNYRPIALLSVFSKIFEKAFQIRLTCFFHKFNLLTTRQYGFCKNRSTQDAVLSFYEQILNNFNNNLKSVGIFFDLSKAFDCINHKLLLKKLEVYGIRGMALNWINSYLRERTQSVKVMQDGQTCFSEGIKVLTGVPQGSVLGPLLFIIFINDIVDNINRSFLTIFADDTSAIISAKDNDVLSKDATNCVKEITRWCNSNGLVLNPHKTNLVFFSPMGVKNDLSVLVRADNNSICQNDCVKFLGVQMDKNLSWQNHTENVIKILATKNFAILQIRDTVNINTLKTFYYGCVNSVLSYGILCWGNCSAVQKVFTMQKRIIRSMFHLSYTTSCRPYFRRHGVLPVYSMYILQAVYYVKRNINEIPRCRNINNYNTRIGNNLYVPAHRLTQGHKGPFITSIKLYNHLPQKLRDIDSLNCFKSSVRKFLADKCFYTESEFYNGCDDVTNLF